MIEIRSISQKGIDFIAKEEIRFIYTLTCPLTNQIRYIGQTKNIKKRIYKHIYSSKNPKTYTQCWIKSLIDKDLKPIIEVLEECDIYTVDENEIFYISIFKSWGFNLTNLEEGGCLNKIISTETIKKLSQINIGRKQSEETKLKRNISLKETWKSEELRELKRKQTLELIKDGVINQKGKASKKKGKPFVGSREKVSLSLKEYYRNNVSSKKIVFDNIEEIIRDYNNLNISLLEISNKYNVARTTITRLMKEHNIPFRNNGKKFISKEILFNLRVNENFSIKEISQKLNCSTQNVEKFVRKWKLQKKKLKS